MFILLVADLSVCNPTPTALLYYTPSIVTTRPVPVHFIVSLLNKARYNIGYYNISFIQLNRQFLGLCNLHLSQVIHFNHLFWFTLFINSFFANYFNHSSFSLSVCAIHPLLLAVLAFPLACFSCPQQFHLNFYLFKSLELLHNLSAYHLATAEVPPWRTSDPGWESPSHSGH